MRASHLAKATALVAALIGWSTPSEACAPAPPRAQTVHVSTEEALIVWDAEHGVEHFVRRALFDTTATTFGFIVPTPTIPKLGEVSATVFDTLATVTAPELIERTEHTFEPSCVCNVFMRSASKGAPVDEEAVRVLAMDTVAGYSAVVLEADEAGALSTWLADHGYDDPPALREWAEPYIAAKWKLTAFRLTADSVGHVQTSVVRMSFATAQPFFPYREPSDQRAPRATRPGALPDQRLLRVYTVASARTTGTIGTSGKWPGLTSYAKPADKRVLDVVAQAVPDYALPPPHAWLTRFDDESSPRPGADEVYFAVAPALGELTPAAKIVVHNTRVRVPVDLAFMLFAFGAVFLVVRRARRKPSRCSTV